MTLVGNVKVVCIPWTQEVKKDLSTKGQKLNCDENMLHNLNLKFHINNGCSNHMTRDINILSYFTLTRE